MEKSEKFLNISNHTFSIFIYVSEASNLTRDTYGKCFEDGKKK